MAVRTDDDPLERGSREHYADAQYYDYTYRRRRADLDFYRRVARQHGSPILELGAGSGRVAVPLALDGHRVTGLDLSLPMLEQARARARALPAGRVDFQAGDMRDFALRRRFPLVIAPFNVLLHLYEPDDFARCFACVRRHLTPTGRFIFDVRVPHLVELARDPGREYVGRPFIHPSLGRLARYTETFSYDPVKQVQHVTMRMLPQGARRPVEVLLTQRQIFPAELRALLRLGGLRLQARYGDFSGRPLAPDDAQEIVVAVRDQTRA
jgi:SAM-dependent methyltransferase